MTVKWREIINWSYACLEALSMQLPILEFNIFGKLWVAAMVVLLDRNYLWKLYEWWVYWVRTGKWPEFINWSYVCVEALGIQLTVLQFNFGWSTLSACNQFFIRQILPMEIRKVTASLDNDVKLHQTSNWSDAWREVLDMQLASLELFPYLVLSGCNSCFIR